MRLIMKRKQKPISRQVKIRSEKEEKDMDDYLLKQIDEFREKCWRMPLRIRLDLVRSF